MTTTPIPLVDIAAQQREVLDDLRPNIERILSDGGFIGGNDVAEFEDAYARFTTASHCIGVANGTDALELALRACGVGAGGEVIIPANTFVATAEAVARIGARPVVVDVDPEGLLMTPTAVHQALSPLTQAVVPVHLFGQAAPVEAIEDALRDTPVVIVEDAAQAQGATRHGRPAGSLGLAGSTSFYPGKNLGAAGDAGAVMTQDAEVSRLIRLLANHGSVEKYVHEICGFNSRLDAIQAVVLSAKLKRLEFWNDARRAAAGRYDELLAELPEVRRPTTLAGNVHVWHLYVIRVSDRDRVLHELQLSGIQAGIHYPTPVHRAKAFQHVRVGGCLEVAEKAADEILSLPIYPHISGEQQEYVVAALRQALGQS